MTTLLADVRIGSQRPRIEHFPLFTTTAADDAIDLAALVGLDLDDWQQYVLRGALGELPGGKWASFRVGLVVPRQNGKNAILEARELAGLFLFGERLIFHTAHQYRTAKGAQKSMISRLKTAPDLLERVHGYDGDPDNVAGFKVGNNEPGITLKSGAQLLYATRGKDSGRGFTGDLVVLDEAYALKLEEMAALVPTMAATSVLGNPQLWFTSSAGMRNSDLLANLRESGISKESDRLAYYEWSAADDADPHDRDAWYQANPGLGVRISEAYVEDELDTLVNESGSDAEFKRERLGIWEPVEIAGIKIPPDKWADAVLSEKLEIIGTPVISVDVRTGLDQSLSIAVAYEARKDDTTTVDVVVLARYESGVNAAWVKKKVLDSTLEMIAQQGLSAIVIDTFGDGNGVLIPLLEDAGVELVKLQTADMRNGAVGFVDGVINGRILHKVPPAIETDHLTIAVTGAVTRPSVDGFLWAQGRSGVDISPIRAASAAWWVLHSTRGSDYDLLDSFA